MQRADALALDTLDVDLDPSTPSAAGTRRSVSSSAPASSKRGEEHVACEPADAVEVRDAGSLATPRDPRRDRPGAEPVVDPDDREPAAHEESIALSAVSPPCAEP